MFGFGGGSETKQETTIKTKEQRITQAADHGAIVFGAGRDMTVVEPKAYEYATQIAMAAQEQNAKSLEKAMDLTTNVLESTQAAYKAASGKGSPININNIALIVGILAAFGMLQKKRA